MDTNHSFRKVLALLFAVFSFAFAQAAEDGSFSSYLGKGAESQEIKKLESDYKCEMVNEDHYRSSTGMELIFKNGKLNQINLYKSSKVYGSFTGKLPNGLVFGSSSADVKKMLGKPSLEYSSSGYSEFELKDYGVSCWYENGQLSQISLALKGS